MYIDRKYLCGDVSLDAVRYLSSDPMWDDTILFWQQHYAKPAGCKIPNKFKYREVGKYLISKKALWIVKRIKDEVGLLKIYSAQGLGGDTVEGDFVPINMTDNLSDKELIDARDKMNALRDETEWEI